MGDYVFSLYKDAVPINITPASKNETYATSDAVPWFFTPMPTNAQTNTSGYMLSRCRIMNKKAKAVAMSNITIAQNASDNPNPSQPLYFKVNEMLAIVATLIQLK